MDAAGLPQRQRHLGLEPTTLISAPALQVGLFAMLVPRLAAEEWSTDLEAVERVLAHLRASLRGEVSEA